MLSRMNVTPVAQRDKTPKREETIPAGERARRADESVEPDPWHVEPRRLEGVLLEARRGEPLTDLAGSLEL